MTEGRPIAPYLLENTRFSMNEHCVTQNRAAWPWVLRIELHDYIETIRANSKSRQTQTTVVRTVKGLQLALQRGTVRETSFMPVMQNDTMRTSRHDRMVSHSLAIWTTTNTLISFLQRSKPCLLNTTRSNRTKKQMYQIKRSPIYERLKEDLLSYIVLRTPGSPSTTTV